jgi:hypothetical protein
MINAVHGITHHANFAAIDVDYPTVIELMHHPYCVYGWPIVDDEQGMSLAKRCLNPQWWIQL